eukprot:TRINITY_DN28_c0_g1_i1.p1 TRINITY_DN28_c0_g1~~TRINITY_DN28_c0_g1_i1.p1  ORF type:complete len:116 (-),score=9.66 TRINITY_DN28_c0_g1_i1:345-662(-)
MASRTLLRTMQSSGALRLSTPQQLGKRVRHMSSSNDSSHDLEEAIKWRNITALAYVLCVGVGIYTFVGQGHHEAHERPSYSYLRIRNKEFPWGPCGLFEWDCKAE